ncbi:MAG: thiolase domain-containing protein, partial [Deltaproteobacteria bacterium]|nr:thiolase domain-containing protein [Deltaproteobacteria bacterium]
MSEDPGRTVAITGVGQSGPAAGDPRSIPEMVLEAVEGALEDAVLGWNEIDAVVTASVDLFDGMTASNVAVTEVVGAVMKP